MERRQAGAIRLRIERGGGTWPPYARLRLAGLQSSPFLPKRSRHNGGNNGVVLCCAVATRVASEWGGDSVGDARGQAVGLVGVRNALFRLTRSDIRVAERYDELPG